jgi:hypothetical protein
MTDMMIDFETLGVSRDSVVLSVGIVLFDEEGKMHEQLYREFDPRPQIVDGRKVMQSTVDWWRKTNLAEFNRLMMATRDDITIALPEMMCNLREQYSITRVWSRHSMDFEILNYQLDNPFPFWVQRDCASLDEFVRMQKKNNHNALDDALNQTEQVIEMRKIWRDAQSVKAKSTLKELGAPVVEA